jgi:OmpA-OmpF porin, OOP family
MALSFLASVSAFGGEVKGMIISRAGATLTVRTTNGNVTVVVTDSTTTKDDRGLFGLDKEHLSDVVLIPGLKVDVDGTSNSQGQIAASTITVDGDDLETAEMIQAGLHPTAQQVATNVQTLETHKAQLAAHSENIQTNRISRRINKASRLTQSRFKRTLTTSRRTRIASRH